MSRSPSSQPGRAAGPTRPAPRARLRLLALGSAAWMLLPAPARGADDARRALEDEVAALRDRVAQLEGLLSAAGLAEPRTSGGLRLSRAGLDATVYGFLTSEAAWESSATGGDRFLDVLPFGRGREEDDDVLFSAHATRLGLLLRAGDVAGRDLDLAGRLEVDFDTPDGGVRIRHAYAELLGAGTELLLGQTWAVVAQLNPETVNSDNLLHLGNSYERVPQIRLARELAVGGGRLRAEIAVLRFFGAFEEPFRDGLPLALQQAPGRMARIASSAPPLGQARIAFWPSGGAGYGALSVSAGRLKLQNPRGRRRTVSHLLAAFELFLPLGERLHLAFEGFFGRAPGFGAGVGQIAALGADGEVHAVHAWGGFAQLGVEPAPGWRCHLVYGIDDPDDRRSGLALSIRRNQTLLANCFWNVAGPLDLAFEVQGVRTEWGAPAPFGADDVRATQAVYLRF